MPTNFPTYEINIDDHLSESGDELGMDMIALVKSPAILTKGFAFDEVKKLKFTDESKMRVIAPVMIPMHIYRFDDEGQYFVRFSEENIEKIFSKFMSNPRKYVFNYEHQADKKVPAYILEAWIVEDPENDKSKKYGIDVPKGTVMMIAQFTNKKYFEDVIVAEGRTGFSIEGFLGMELIDNIKTKINKETMSVKKHKYEAAYLADGTPIWMTKKEVDGEVYVIDENMEKAPIFDGEHELADGSVVVTVNGKITEIKDKKEAEMAVDGIEEAEVEEEVSQDEVEAAADVVAEEIEEEKAEDEAVKMALDEAEVMAIVQPKIDELIQMIAELKAALVEEEVAEEMMSSDKPTELSLDQRFSFVKNLVSKAK